MTAVQTWIDAWKQHATADVHPQDRTWLEEQRLENIFEPLGSDNCQALHRRTGRMRSRLGAMPFVGHLETADIFLLMINPGVGCDDYKDAERGLPETIFKQNKMQQLDHCFALREGASDGWSNYYIQKMFPGVLSRYGDRQKALEDLSRRVAILELIPYYSQNASLIDQADLTQLPTAKLAKEAAKELSSNKNNLMITRWKRGAERWGVGNAIPSICRSGMSKGAKEAIWKRVPSRE